MRRRHRRVLIVVAVLALVACASTLWFSAAYLQTDRVTVSFVGYTTDASGRRMAMFRYLNQGHATVVSPDDCLTQKEGSDPGTLARLCDIILAPGDARTILIPPPETRGGWRIRLGHYPEDWRHRLKISIARGCKRLNIPKSFIPSGLRTVRTCYVWSDWVTDQVSAVPGK